MACCTVVDSRGMQFDTRGGHLQANKQMVRRNTIKHNNKQARLSTVRGCSCELATVSNCNSCEISQLLTVNNCNNSELLQLRLVDSSQLRTVNSSQQQQL
jgi:hypothetical protein